MKNPRRFFLFFRSFVTLLFAYGCTPSLPLAVSKEHPEKTGSAFYNQAVGYSWQQRDSLALEWMIEGFVPRRSIKLSRVNVVFQDSITGEKIKAHYFVTTDYFSLGNDKDWARIPLTPMAAQRIANRLGCFLPASKMVDDIYKAAKVKLEPVPLFAYRDSTPTFWHHHLMIEGQRQGKKGLIAGIKKDVIITGKLNEGNRRNRVAIYGWHRLNGQPIQPVYTGHVNWYVDYSHGIRLVYPFIIIRGKRMLFADVLIHPVYRKLLTNEQANDFIRYHTE